MMFRLTRKRAILGVATVCVLVIAAGAYAYFTTTGAGTATATVGSKSTLTLKATMGGSLYPGSSTTVTFTVDNPSQGTQYVKEIKLASVTADASHSSCTVADFTMPAVSVNKEYGPGNGQSVPSTGTLTMANTNVNQDACQGATLTLNLTSN